MKYYTISIIDATHSDWQECYEEYDKKEDALKYATEFLAEGNSVRIIEHDEEEEGVKKCKWCEHRHDTIDLKKTDIGNLCSTCIEYIRSRGEPITVYYGEDLE